MLAKEAAMSTKCWQPNFLGLGIQGHVSLAVSSSHRLCLLCALLVAELVESRNSLNRFLYGVDLIPWPLGWQ